MVAFSKIIREGDTAGGGGGDGGYIIHLYCTQPIITQERRKASPFSHYVLQIVKGWVFDGAQRRKHHR
jgi:hypothetical protein